ncbi:unnamed protein product [Rotaria magnacalcarata]|uniref:Contactin n=4 Tax=Rotaria magnacalcarata TaxID=392030 RepID=A0A814FFB8_9BILA|nr:unnamed protein product [Rotaria magnacalcarata]CAF3963029.1 unnamed protein product [Rotaria magnacalcarata]
MNLHLISLLIIFVLQFIFAQILKCPHGWEEFVGTASCYRFYRFPQETYSGAVSHCPTDLLSVESFNEHLFIQNWLTENDPSAQRWLTSGKRNGLIWQWTKRSGLFNFQYDQGWLPLTEEEKQKGSFIVYTYQSSQWGWLPYDIASTETLPFICEVPLQESYGIFDDYRGIEYGLPSTIEEYFIPRGPKFYEQPQDQEYGHIDQITLGSESTFGITRASLHIIVTFTCRADAYPVVEYYWFRMITNSVSDAVVVNLTDPRYFQHGGNLMINNPTNEDSGTYFCKAINYYGAAITKVNNESLLVLDRFEKRERPNVIAHGHRDAIMDCLYRNTNTGDLNYAWFKGGINQKVQQTLERFISRNGNLYFSRVTDGDAGRYYCAVQAKNSRLRYLPSQTSEGTELVVRSTFGQERGPRIFPSFPHIFPMTRLPKLSENISIECISEGYPIPSYRWFRQDPRGSFYSLQSKVILNNYNRELIIPNLQRDDMGLYTCEASNTRSVVHESVALQIQIDPVFVTPLEDQMLDVGSILKLHCEAYTNELDQLRYSWFINATEIVFSQLTLEQQLRLTIKNNELMITNVQIYDNGIYQCSATNVQSDIQRFSTAEVRIITLAPTFSRNTMASTLRSVIGSLVPISCHPEGAPQPQIQWFKNNIPLIMTNNIQIFPNGNLAILNVQLFDSGNYTCIATNPYGIAQQSTFVYVMFEGTTILSTSGSRDAIVDQTIVLSCDARSINQMDLTFHWRFNNEILTIDNQRFQQDNFDRPGDLRIVKVQYSNAGLYTCVAQTTIDKQTSFYQLNVLGPPGPVAGVRCSNPFRRQATLSWVVGSEHGSPILYYTVESLSNYRSWWMFHGNFSITLPFNKFITTTLSDLSAFTDYSFRVFATNVYGSGERSDVSATCTTQPDIPGLAPTDLGGGGGKVGDLRITWNPLPMEFWNGPNLTYRIYVQKKGENRRQIFNVIYPLRNFLITHLADKLYYFPYDVRISAVNSLGEGPISGNVTVRSAEDRPTRQVLNVKCYPYNSTALTVTWDMIDENDFEILHGSLLGYTVRYWRKDVDELQNYWERRFPGQRSRAIIIGLQSNIEYCVRVSVYTPFGDSPESDYFSHRTFRLSPQTQPQYISIRQPQSEKDKRVRLFDDIYTYKLEVEWRGISTSADEEPLEGYMVKVWEYHQSIRNATIYYGDRSIYSMIIDNLYKNRKYKLRVQAWSLGGEGKYSSPVTEFRFDNDGRLLILYNPDTSLHYQNTASNSYLLSITLFLVLNLHNLFVIKSGYSVEFVNI